MKRETVAEQVWIVRGSKTKGLARGEEDGELCYANVFDGEARYMANEHFRSRIGFLG